MTETDLKKKTGTLLEEVKRIVAEKSSRDVKLQEICRLLASEVEVFDWVGFYLVDPDADRELVLGPFVGEETDHTRIPYGKGICGQAADTEETFVVKDVSKASNYLSCSADVKAEIVIPVMKEGRFVAELDIDSHTRDSITEQHRVILEKICEITADIF